MRRRTPIIVLVTALLPLACGADKMKADENPAVLLTVWNKTLFDIEDLRIHPNEAYAGTTNLMSENLADETSFDIAQFRSGYRVTAMRRTVEGGALVAFTTARGLVTPRSGYVLLVFQQSFRLVPPVLSDGGPGDDGATSDGGGDGSSGDSGPSDGASSDGAGDVDGDSATAGDP